MLQTLFSVISLAGIGLCPGHPWAAPYCLEIANSASLCIYWDAGQCYRNARKQGVNCTVNQQELQLPSVAAGRFCLVLNGGIFECAYPDRRSCNLQAGRRHGLCADRFPEKPDVDLFRH